MSKKVTVEKDSKNELLLQHYHIQNMKIAGGPIDKSPESDLNYSSSMSSYNATASGNMAKRRSASNKNKVGLKKTPSEGINNVSKFIDEGANVYQY